MYLFYIPDVTEDEAIFSQAEAQHCTQVLRKKEGDLIKFTDGKGSFYEGQIEAISKRKGQVKVLKKTTVAPPSYNLKIAIAPTKNINRLEWFVEKACEIGISDFYMLKCHHSERMKVRIDRLEKIIISACKQSLKAHFPRVHELMPFKDFMAQPMEGSKFIAFCDPERTQNLKTYVLKDEIYILIGPEGDFSSTEIELAVKNGFQGLALGDQRLRTETAGLQACSWVNYHFS